MSADEIRTQKALALLDLKEAEAKIQELDKEKASLVEDFKAVAEILGGEVSNQFAGEKYQHVSWDTVGDLAHRIAEARKVLTLARDKTREFGLL